MVCVCVCVRILLQDAPPLTHMWAHTHILTFSGYLGRQVVVPLPVAKQLPSPLPLQHARNVRFFFVLFFLPSVCVCVPARL